VRLEVGRIGRAHGLRGDVSIVPITNRSERFAPGSVLFAGDRELRITRSRRQGDRWIVGFEGVDDRNGAEGLRNQLLMGAELAGAPGDELWVHELIGAEVRDRAGVALGSVVAVEANPAHDLLVLESGALVPVVFVVAQADGIVTVDLPEGLLDL
jgi:16S rRNA processing protein RimM